jgi:DUF4097 and DUF4098 domain-containing protein YvlB
MRRSLLAVLMLAAATTAASAQSDRAARFLDNCRDRDDAVYCEVRNVTMAATGALSVDGRDNGGISVHGWNRNDVQVVAMVQVHDETDADARAIAKQINVVAAGSEIHAEGPREGRRQSWSVSYEIYAPRGTALALTAANGGLSVEAIEARMELTTVNGGISLNDVGGEVHGSTTNGGITASLSGSAWRGTGLDLRTTNGGVRITLPSDYSANIEAETMNGGMNVDFPITVLGRLGKRLSTQIGRGGPLIRAITTNGGVSIRRG